MSFLIVTKGSSGAIAYTRDALSVEVSASKVTVVDTVGAGDTFNAGVLVKMDDLNLLSKLKIRELSRLQLEEILTYSAKVAAITVSRAGANPPRASEVADYNFCT